MDTAQRIEVPISSIFAAATQNLYKIYDYIYIFDVFNFCFVAEREAEQNQGMDSNYYVKVFVSYT